VDPRLCCLETLEITTKEKHPLGGKRTDCGDGGHDLTKLKLVQNCGLTGGIETHLEDKRGNVTARGHPSQYGLQQRCKHARSRDRSNEVIFLTHPAVLFSNKVDLSLSHAALNFPTVVAWKRLARSYLKNLDRLHSLKTRVCPLDQARARWIRRTCPPERRKLHRKNTFTFV